MSARHLVSLHLILLLLWWPWDTTYAIVADSISQAKPGCQQKCGEIVIPYPFGIGKVGISSCYLDGWFEIDCRNNSMSTARPFLKRLSLEVLNISCPYDFYSSENLVKVNSPIIRSSNCSRSSRASSIRSGVAVRQHVDMKGSTFTFLSSLNRFAVVGCNHRALMSTDQTGLIYWMHLQL